MDKILLVDDDATERRTISTLLKSRGFQVKIVTKRETATELFAQMPDIIVTDLTRPRPDGLGLVQEAHKELPETPVIIIAPGGSVTGAVGTMKQGPFDYLTRPIDPQELLRVIQEVAELSRLQRHTRRLRHQAGGLLGIVGNSEPMRRVFEQICMVAPTRSTVLITGESGTGKELVARAIHELSPRKDGPFVALNCVAIPKELAESELFGHAKGAFTGATDRRIGKFGAANGGTLLIDELGEMELPLQARLLRSLETRTICPIGSNTEQRVDVRVVAATHRNLRSLVSAGSFREDLYFRLHVVQIDLPPLRERRDDIPLLLGTFLEQLNKEHNRNVREIAHDAMNALQAYSWPGNVRESRNVLEGTMVMSHKEMIELDDLPPEIQQTRANDSAPPDRHGISLVELEREAIQQCLIDTSGNRRRTAELLGISTRTLLRKIRLYSLEDPLRPTTQDSPDNSALP